MFHPPKRNISKKQANYIDLWFKFIQFVPSHSHFHSFPSLTLIPFIFSNLQFHSLPLIHFTYTLGFPNQNLKMSEEEDSGMVGEAQMPRRHDHKGGKINRFEPIITRELMTSPITFSCFKHMGCFDFCERVQQVQNHPELTRLFSSIYMKSSPILL